MRRPLNGVPQGDPEYTRDVYRERHLGLLIRGEFVDVLGLLAIRCERHGDRLTPLTMCIAETPVVTTVFRNRPESGEE